jgi:hypothetical protein
MFDNNYLVLSPFTKKQDFNNTHNIPKYQSNNDLQDRNFLNQKRNRDDNNFLTFSPSGNVFSCGIKPMTPVLSAALVRSPNIHPVFMFESMLNPYNTTPIIAAKNGSSFPQFCPSNYGFEQQEAKTSNIETETEQTPGSKNENIMMVNTPPNNYSFYTYFPQTQNTNSNMAINKNLQGEHGTHSNYINTENKRGRNPKNNI